MRRTRHGQLILACAVALALSASACVAAPSGRQPPIRTEHAAVPAVPLPVARSMQVDAELIDAAACVECDRADGPDRDRFFSGRLALGSLDALLADPRRADRAGQGGNLFVSGYFGGLQLRGVLGSIGARDQGPAAPLFDLVGRSTLAGLDQQVGRLQRLAAEGSDWAVRNEMTGLLPVLALLYGYNLGYLRETLERAPEGVVTSGRIDCPTELSCRTPSLALEGGAEYDPTFAWLDTPSPDRALTATWINSLVAAAEPGGRAVWAQLLSGDGFAVEGFEAIVDLSGGFLQVAGAALAGAAEAQVGGDAALARASLAVTAGLLAWAGSYFLGLASPLADDDLPQLTCGN